MNVYNINYIQFPLPLIINNASISLLRKYCFQNIFLQLEYHQANDPLVHILFMFLLEFYVLYFLQNELKPF